MTEPRRKRVLFVCTGNSCRSQMAEALLRQLGGDRFEALSAGSQPAGFVHPLAVEAMTQMNVPIGNPESKSWERFRDEPLDVVITVCDSAAGESCPVWHGAPITAHWSLPDPVYHPGSESDRVEFALRVARRLYAKIEGLVKLDWSADRARLTEQIQRLGHI